MIYEFFFGIFFLLYQLIGDISWEFEVLESIKLKCIIEVVINVEMWVIIGGVFVLQEDVVDNFCLNECSGKGDCVKGRYLKYYLLNYFDCF